MSNGSKIVQVRMKPALLAAVRQEVAKRNDNPLLPEETLSDWLRTAALEHLKHASRSRKKRGVK